MDSQPYYSFGGIRRQPREGSATQTSGVASKWIPPQFTQPIGEYSNRPENRGGQIVAETPGHAMNTSEVGALGRIDSAVKIIEPYLPSAPLLPNQKPSESMVRRNIMLSKLQNDFVQAERRDQKDRMRRIIREAAELNQVPIM
jgi:hypothetical protein